MARVPQGLVLWEGDSRINGDPIVAIATGFRRRSKNRKTGQLIHTWILDQRLRPTDAAKRGLDRSVCGDCPLVGGRCYVNLGQAPNGVYSCWLRGGYSDDCNPQWFRGVDLRIGSYGDPAAIPSKIWTPLRRAARSAIGYTHQWDQPRFGRFRQFLMASVHSQWHADRAIDAGWRYYLTTRDEPKPGQFRCPASDEENHRLTCAECGACDGAQSNTQRACPIIKPHGNSYATQILTKLIEE